MTAAAKRRKASIAASPRKVTYQSPIDRATGYEVAWQQVAQLFDAARRVDNPCFVYFIGEEDGGAVKIGSAKDPVHRLRGLQTGNPRRLRIEHVLVGRASLEFLLHELWERFAIKSKRIVGKVDAPAGTEWFTAEIRKDLEPILRTAAERQAEYVTTGEGDLDLDELERIVREAHAEHGFIAKGRDEVRLLGAQMGTVTRRRSRI